MGSEFITEGGDGESTGELMVANGATLPDNSSLSINESSHPENFCERSPLPYANANESVDSYRMPGSGTRRL